MVVLTILTLIGICVICMLVICMLVIDTILSIFNQPNYAKLAIGDKEYSNLINTIIDNGELHVDKSRKHELVYSCNDTTFYISLNPFSFGNRVTKYNGTYDDGTICGELDRKTMYKLYKINKAIEIQKQQNIIDSFKSSI